VKIGKFRKVKIQKKDLCGLYFGCDLTLGNKALDPAEMELDMIKTRAILKKQFESEPAYEEVQAMAIIFEKDIG